MAVLTLLNRSSEKIVRTNFVHLHTYSYYSPLYGVHDPETLCRVLKLQGAHTVALTDRNGLYGMIRFLQAAKQQGLRAIVGCELVTVQHRALCLVSEVQGYRNLCQIISNRHTQPHFNLITELQERRTGLIIVSDHFELLRALQAQQENDLYVELSYGHNMTTCLAYSRQSRLPVVATQRAVFLEKKDLILHRILRAIDLNTKISRLGVADMASESDFLCSSEVMQQRFCHLPEALANSVKIAEECWSNWDDVGKIIFPTYENLSDREAYIRLRWMVSQGCVWRYQKLSPEVQVRMNRELELVAHKNLAHYFLIVHDIVFNSKPGKLRLTCGRGSAAASLIAYALGITHVDPIAHNLFFERFLNEGRLTPPDIDIDFAWDERDEVLAYVFSHFGTERAAMVANLVGFNARGALREVARVYGLSEADISQFTSKISFYTSSPELQNKIGRDPKLKGVEWPEPWPEIIEQASRLNTHLHYLSVHCGGCVIVPDQIRNYVPVQISRKGLPVLQWEKDQTEDAGLVKIDLLGNRSLAVIRDTLEAIQLHHGVVLSYENLNPVNEEAAIRTFYSANTMGVFYFESPATRQVLIKVAHGISWEEYQTRDHFEMNVVVTSIIRPGSNSSINLWVQRLHGQVWQHLHPLLAPVLDETLGIMVYQEQMSKAAIAIAHFNEIEADDLRKVVTKKHKTLKLLDYKQRFFRGAHENQVSLAIAQQIWDLMMEFDGYSFCKPHSASYTQVAYKSAYLRDRFPAEFMAAVLSNQGGYYSTFAYISECRRMGISVLLPDINLSAWHYRGKNKKLRVGLMQLREIRQKSVQALLTERERGGPFKNFSEFLRRITLPLEDIRVLIKAGCFDGLCGGSHLRPRLLWQAAQEQDNRSLKMARQPSLFSDSGSEFTQKQESFVDSQNISELPQSEPYTQNIILKHEVEALGMLISCHPLSLYQNSLKRFPSLLDAKNLKQHYQQAQRKKEPPCSSVFVNLLGWLVTAKTVSTKQNEPMQFLSFEDTSALYEAVLFPEMYRKFCRIISYTRPFVLSGILQETHGDIMFILKGVQYLET